MKRVHQAPAGPPTSTAVGLKVHGSILVEIGHVTRAPEA